MFDVKWLKDFFTKLWWEEMKLKDTTASNSFRYGWLLGRIFPFIKPVLGRVILGFLVAIPVGALDGIVSVSLKPFMDYVVGKQDWSISLLNHHLTIPYSMLALAIPFGVVLFAAIQGVLRYLNSYLTDWTSQKITNSVKISLFNKLCDMDASFFDENSSGVIITRFLSDPDTASTGIVNNLKTFVTALFGALSLIAVMLYCSWKLAVIGVVVLGAAFIPVALIRKRVKSTSNKNMVIGGNITTNFNETYIGNKVMRSYSLEERQKNLFCDQIWKAFANNMSLVKRSGWMSPLMYLIASVGIALVLGYGTHLIYTDQMTAGGFASFVTSLLLLYKPVKTLGNTLTGLQTIFVAMGRVFELFDIQPTIKDADNAVEMNGLTQGIEFENINFAYVEDRLVLKNINYKVNKGETIAVVGNSGGGKSTLVNLIPRFYDVTDGAVKIDGIDIRNYSLSSLRANISMVFQDNFLFSGTIRDNILMGNVLATEDDLKKVIEYAHLEELIKELPEGLDTILGERGTTLSGGQRQRVAIARAMIKDAPIIILDEATSALDNESEAIVQKALDNLMSNKTVFVIAHRLSTIQNADRIIVIKDGELLEAGTHDELMTIQNGEYRHLYEMQFKHQETVQ